MSMHFWSELDNGIPPPLAASSSEYTFRNVPNPNPILYMCLCVCVCLNLDIWSFKLECAGAQRPTHIEWKGNGTS